MTHSARSSSPLTCTFLPPEETRCSAPRQAPHGRRHPPEMDFELLSEYASACNMASRRPASPVNRQLMKLKIWSGELVSVLYSVLRGAGLTSMKVTVRSSATNLCTDIPALDNNSQMQFCRTVQLCNKYMNEMQHRITSVIQPNLLFMLCKNK